MKKHLKYILLLLFAIFILTANITYSQDIGFGKAPVEKNDKEISVFLDSPIFYKDWYGKSQYIMLTGQVEMLFHKTNRLTNPALNIGFGYSFANFGIESFFIPIEVNLLTGLKKHNLETGMGLSIGWKVMVKARLGYRLYIKNHFLLRIAYTPYFWLPAHHDTEDYPKYTGANTLSIGLGYRFGKQLR